jgi:hypothetical protein
VAELELASLAIMSSDREGPTLGNAPPADEDLSLPKATVQKMISGPT